MVHWDDRNGIPRSALTALPLLFLPTLIGALLLLLSPERTMGTAAVVFSTVAVSWYLLGGAIALTHVRRRFHESRALSAIRGEVAAAPEPVWISDPNGVVLYTNPAAEERFGDLAGQGIQNLLMRFRADGDATYEVMARQAGRGACAELSLDNGEVLALSCAPDAPLQIWSYHLPGEMAAEYDPSSGLDGAADADSLEFIPVAMLRLAGDGTVLRANRMARQLLEDRVPPGGGRIHLASLLDGPGRALGDWIADIHDGRIAASPEMLRLRQSARRTDAVDRYFQMSLSPDPTHPGALLAVLVDASAQKTLEAQFVQSQKMQAIGQLAGGVAHDFNNLLTAIRGHCDLLMLRHDRGDPDYADLDQISQNVNRAAALVGQLLAFSRKQTLRLETLNLRDTLADLTHLLNRLVGERVTLTIRHESALKAIRADKRQLEQVIMNLVVNARDAMPNGGDILVTSGNVVLPEGLAKGRFTLPKGEYVRITVEDEGTGISPENLDKIFEPFFTTKRTGEGTGLGLSTVYGIVKQTGGYICCDSVVGKGTCFSLYFPAHDLIANQPAPQPVVAIASAPASERPATVLLVEDEAPVRAFAARALKLKGYDVLEAESAEEALDIIQSSNDGIDLFITDVVMPGMDGPSWVRLARQTHPQTPVIFMSGYTEGIFAEGDEPIGNSAFLAKPFTLAELAGIVQKRLSGEEVPVH